jgi:hypothetical protein
MDVQLEQQKDQLGIYLACRIDGPPAPACRTYVHAAYKRVHVVDLSIIFSFKGSFERFLPFNPLIVPVCH